MVIPRSLFKVVGVHDALGHLLVLAENSALGKHLIHKGGFTVVNVGDNGNISYVFFSAQLFL